MAAAGGAAVVLAGVEVAQSRSGGANGVAERTLLDIHMEGVEHELKTGMRNPVDKLNGLLGDVDEAGLEAVQRLHAEHHSEPGGIGGQGPQLLHQQRKVLLTLRGSLPPEAPDPG